MFSTRLRASLALVLAAFTAACGDDGSTGPSFPDSVSTADAEDFADGVADYASSVASAINFNGPSVGVVAPAIVSELRASLGASSADLQGRSFAQPDLSPLDWRNFPARARVRGPQLAADGCTVTIRGSDDPYGEQPTDQNENGIPDDYYAKIVCTESGEGGGDTLYTATMTQEIAYKEIASSLYGVTMSIAIRQEQHDNYGHYMLLDYDIDARQDIRSDGIEDEASFKVRQESKITDDPVVWVEAGESWDNAFDPTGAITPESNIPDGALTIGGRRYFADSEGDENVSFTISTPTALAYNAACAAVPTNPPFTAGVLLGELNGSSSQASFEVTFTACGNYAVDVDGAYDGPVEVTAGR